MNHSICVGCEKGALRAEAADVFNAQNEMGLCFMKSVEANILTYGDQSPYRDPKTKLADELEVVHDAIGTFTLQMQVVCRQEGPTRLLGRCGARKIIGAE